MMIQVPFEDAEKERIGLTARVEMLLLSTF